MAKRRGDAAENTEHSTKKLKQVLKKGCRAKARGKKKDAGNSIKQEEDEIKRKVQPKPCSSTKRGAEKKNSNTSKTTTAVKTSKYFQSPVKEEADKLSGPLGPPGPSEPVLPTQPVEIEIEIETSEVRKKKKRQAEFETYLRRMMNKIKKDVLIDTHKVHLMCLIAGGMFRSSLCSEPDLLAITLSLLPTHYSMVAKERIDQNYLSGLLKWFRATFTLNPSLSCEERPDPRTLLERRLASLSGRDHQEMTHMFLLVLRSLQLFCRLVISFQPIPLKAPSAKGKGAKTSPGAPGKGDTSQDTSKNSSPESKVSLGTKRGGNIKGGPGGKKAKTIAIKDQDEKTITSGGQRPKNSKRRSIASKVTYKEESNSDEEKKECGLSDEDEFQATSEEGSEESEGGSKSKKGTKGKGKSKNTAAPKRRSSGGGGKEEGNEREVDDKEEEGITSIRKKQRSGNKAKGPGADEWLEVFLEKTSSWVCVHVEQGVGLPHLCSQNATTPVTYVVAVDGHGFVKDLGRKYDPTWLTTSRKRRVDEDWWDETLGPFLGPEDERDKKEEKELQSRLMNKPLPVSIAEYKNHPLYALKRHLLKYDAIYPATAAVLGYCRGEPVYSRDCVHSLHSKDTWLKEARTVRLGEEPFKMVKGFSNRSRKARMASGQTEEKDLAVFGEWQTEEYQPPLAVDGKVPRNEYGNVYLFKPCMLPVGSVHLRLPNLNRVARKLEMDAAPAVTGFDFHGGYSHAVTDGYIVCEEHEEILRAAWAEEQEIQKQKEKEKKEKRVISNWTLLVKGLQIKEKLKQRYGKLNQGLLQGEEAAGLSSDEEGDEGGSPSDKTASETLAMSWPRNKQAEEDGGSISGLKRTAKTKREKKGQEKHMFPFEKV
ncbi:hypothetical protein JOQ06_006701 [Pogonophryne albipinna]|uniref:DNA repair protein complementing XP-C cells n=1 Tax=Pogonophryne albipinna TaxID=1090488 RepID=A0AAD6FGF8_9TELE|nr:hypothetical protein JOQ06_006701 [Pogonophryne albipinna]